MYALTLFKSLFNNLSKPLIYSCLCLSSLALLPNPIFSVHTPAQATAKLNGPLLGAVEMTSVKIWLQTDASATIKLRYWPSSAKGGADSSQAKEIQVQTEATQQFAQTVTLSRLAPGVPYDYQIWVDGELVQRERLSFRTQVFWQKRQDPPDFKIALGSCVYLNDAVSDPPKSQLGGDYGIFDSIAAAKPDLMLWLGDNIYLRPLDFYSAQAIHDRYRQSRALPELQKLWAQTAHYAIWDDHDYGPDDSDRSYRQREDSLAAFQNNWPNPSYGLAQTAGVFTHFEWSDVSFILTDNRYHRAPNRLNDPNKDYFGPAQWQWLKDTLSASEATFKLVALGNQILNQQTPSENMYSYTRAYQEFLDWLAQSEIPGVLLVSGDRHHAELFKLPRQGTYPLYEWTVSPLTSKAYPPYPVETEVPIRVPGSLYKARNFGLIEVSGPPEQRVLDLRLMNIAGQEQWHTRISAHDLRKSSYNE